MGFDKCILPAISVMEAQITQLGIDEFVRVYSKYDSIMGESDRVNFLETKINEYEKNINNNSINYISDEL